MPAEKVGSRTLEGAKLRRHVLRGAVIVFVTAGYSGKRFVFEKAKELGVRSVIIDGMLLFVFVCGGVVGRGDCIWGD